MASLYRMTTELAMLERMTEEGREISESEMSDLVCLIKNKVDSCADYSRYLNTRLCAIENRIDELKELAASEEKKIARMHNLYKFSLEALGVKELVGVDSTLKLALKPPSLRITDETLIPSKYIATKFVESSSVDKRALLTALKNGEKILGCEIQQETKVVIK